MSRNIKRDDSIQQDLAFGRRLSNVEQLIRSLTSPEDGDIIEADKHYTHIQAVPASTWTINHDMGKKPAVSVFDTANSKLEPDENHTSDDTLILTFKAAGIAVETAGTAELN